MSFFPTFSLGRGGWSLTELISMDLLNNMCLCSLSMFGTLPEWSLSCSSQLPSEGGDLNADCFLVLLCKPLVRKGQYPSFRAVVKEGLTADQLASMSLSKLAAWIIRQRGQAAGIASCTGTLLCPSIHCGTSCSLRLRVKRTSWRNKNRADGAKKKQKQKTT